MTDNARPICDNCGAEIPEDRKHHEDPYEKGVCQTFMLDGKPAGWVRNRKTVDFSLPNIEGRKKLAT